MSTICNPGLGSSASYDQSTRRGGETDGLRFLGFDTLESMARIVASVIPSRSRSSDRSRPVRERQS
jgi:hypothetical protein